MSITSPVIEFGTNAFTIKGDISSISLTTGTLQSFSNLDDLESNNYSTRPYATFEPDFWKMDGNYMLMPSSAVHVGLMTTDMSDENGSLAYLPAYPELTIIFDSVHSSDNLTLYFSQATGDWCDNLAIVYFDASNNTISDVEYTPSSYVFSTNQAVANYKKIVISFYSTNKPYRCVRLRRIDFDTLTQFTGAEIKSARLIESVNPLSVELPSNSLEFDLYSSAAAFSITNPTGVYANLQYKQPIDAYEIVDGETWYLGHFYLDEWNSKSANLAHFKASDAVGLLDTKTYLGGVWNVALPDPSIDSDELILDILTTTAGIDYTLDASLEGISLTGYVPRGSCRDALQQVCFAIGAFVSCARSDVINILPIELASDLVAYDYTLTAADKGQESPVELRPLVTGAEVVEHNYISDGVTTGATIFSGTWATGAQKILFNGLYADFDFAGSATYTGGDNHGNYVIFTVTGAGTATLTQVSTFSDGQKLIGVYNGSLPAGTPANIIRVNDATLVNSSNSSTVTQRVYDYFDQRYLQKTKLFAHAATVGNSVLIDTQSSKQIKGIIERMESDLAGGMVQRTEIIGVIAA